MGKTLYEKIWESHLIHEGKDTIPIIYIDRHLVHEVTSPQAFEGLKLAHRKLRQPEKMVATMDHCIPTRNRHLPIADPVARKQVETMEANCTANQVILYHLEHPSQGIIHVIAPENGFIQPGMTVVCGDSHTATHGAFGTLAFGIGTTEVEHVMATQTLQQRKSKTMRVRFSGKLRKGVTAKDMALALIGKTGTAGGTGHVIEYTGEAIRNLSMEGRMTLCNMAIEGGARAGMITPDETTVSYLKKTPNAPHEKYWEEAVAYWKTMVSDPDAIFDKEITIHISDLKPQVTWGTSPEQVVNLNGTIPSPADYEDRTAQEACQKALDYMGLNPGDAIADVAVDYVFIGSCTNSRLEDLREAAAIVTGNTIHASVTGIVVPGSFAVKRQAEKEGLDRIFLDAGFEWREAGCSMCLAMNDDVLQPGQRCASTSNRNFIGRQGKESRTHLVSPITAAATAIEGHFANPNHRQL